MAGVPILATATIADATAEQAMAAFDYTCRYYLGISGTEFLARLDAGLIQPLQEAPGLRQVLEMLPLVRE